MDESDLKGMVDNAAELTQVARQLSERDRDYYDGFQYTPAEIAVLQKRKQPVITDNRIRRKVDAIVGLEQKGRIDPRALPRNPDDEESADIATKALVFVDDITRLDSMRSAFCYNLAIEGYGGVEVIAKEGKNGFDPDIVRLRWEEIFYDPYSREADFSDAEYMGVQKWMSLESAVAFASGYTDAKEEDLRDMLRAGMESTLDGDTYEDRPQEHWGHAKLKRVKLAYMYYRDGGEWRLAVISGGGVISDEPSPYVDETGKPCCAIILQSCYVDRENRRAGIVRDMISLQDETNKRRSKLLHLMNSRQTMGQRGATVLQGAALKRELAAPDGHIEYDQDTSTTVPSFQIVPQMDQIAGQFKLLEFTTQAMDNLGPNASLLGSLTGQNSGRAIMAQQQAGMAELAPFYDAIRDWNLRVYRAIWNRIKQYWTEERWIRVTDQPDKLQFIGINVPTPQVDQMGNPMIDPMTGMSAVTIENQIGELDVDIIIDMAPDYAVLQQEEFERLTDLVQAGMLQLPPEVIIRASQLRNKAELIEAVTAGPQDPQMQEMQQRQQQMEQMMFQLEARLKETKAMDQEASAQKKMIEAQAVAADIGRAPDHAPDGGMNQMDAQLKLADIASRERIAGQKAQIDGAKASADIGLKRAQTARTLAEPFRTGNG